MALTLRAVFRLALRQTKGLIGSIIALLGLDLAVPDHTTLSRRAESLDVVCPRSCSGPVHLLVDSTGLKLCGSGEWLLEKHGTGTRRSWRKLHIAVDADTGQIAAAALTTSDVDDASQIGAFLLMAGPEPLGPVRLRHHSEETSTTSQSGCKPITASLQTPYSNFEQHISGVGVTHPGKRAAVPGGVSPARMPR